MHVEIIREDGPAVSGELANLTRSSVFVKTVLTPRFRAEIKLRFEGIEIQGEVALVAGEPRGFVLAFEAPPALRLSLAALQSQIDVLGDGPWLETTSPSEPPDAPDYTPVSPELVEFGGATSETPALRLPDPVVPPARPPAPAPLPPRSASQLAVPPVPPPVARTIPSRTPSSAGLPAPAPRAPSRAASRVPPIQPPAEPLPRAPTPARLDLEGATNLVLIPSAPPPPAPPAPPASPPRAASVAMAPAPAAPTPAPRSASTAAGPASTSLPELGVDGMLRFQAAGDFAQQFRSNIVHGGIIARSTPLGVGSFHVLKLTVPGIRETLELRARVGFVGDGTVGFMIDSFPVEKPRLESLLAKVSAPTA
ncbi:MAG: hypothetical protein U1E65_16775 [Myxococcota bacterium]